MKDTKHRTNDRSELDAIGLRIRECRKILGLHQKAMAQALGISSSYFNEIELSKTIAGGEILQKLSKTYKMNVEYLVTGNGEPFSKHENPKPQPKPVDNEFSLEKNIDTIEKLLKLMEQSSYVRLSILLYATKLMMEEGDSIRNLLKESSNKKN